MYLRELRPSDVKEHYCRWMNDQEVVQYLESRFSPHSIESLREYVSQKASSTDEMLFAIVLKADERHIGNIKLGPIDWIHRSAQTGIIIGEKDQWGQGYATEAILAISRFAFSALNLRKLSAGCYEPNRGSVKAFERAGFVQEGILRAHYFCNGNYVDGILFGKLA